MASDKKRKQSNGIPIRFFDSDEVQPDGESGGQVDEATPEFDESVVELEPAAEDISEPSEASEAEDESKPAVAESTPGGPQLAELIASRAELKRLEAALAEAQESFARRQADFENYRKRIERERGEAYNRVVADVTRKLLPVLDNLNRALEAERSVETNESQEFSHFLHGVELIGKQLNEVLESFGVQPIAAVGERFDPHVHEAVVTEASDDHEPDTVIEELARGYRIGDRLLRPSMVKVSARKASE